MTLFGPPCVVLPRAPLVTVRETHDGAAHIQRQRELVPCWGEDGDVLIGAGEVEGVTDGGE
jgi:hypothetical protein